VTNGRKYHQIKPKIVSEKSTYYTPFTLNRFEPLSNLLKNAEDRRPERDNDIEPRSYSECLKGKYVHKENTPVGNYKITTKVSKRTGKKLNSTIISNHVNQQAHTKVPTHAIPVLVSGLTSLDASTKNVRRTPNSSVRQKKKQKVISSATVMPEAVQAMRIITSMAAIGPVVS
jgi:hypothetical protein